MCQEEPTRARSSAPRGKPARVHVLAQHLGVQLGHPVDDEGAEHQHRERDDPELATSGGQDRRGHDVP